jgi:3-dehydroquinate synthetase
MVDSSVGGKTGINMPQGKNLVGTFHQPDSVLCDLDVLKTLPEREMKAGYAEILKYALLGDACFFTWLEEHGQAVLMQEPKTLRDAIYQSCEMKARIVQLDEKEHTGQRALLNLGHTFAHSFESVMNYDGRVLHGEAVGVGLLCALRLSAREGYISSEDILRVENHMLELGLKTTLNDLGMKGINLASLIELMGSDKKASQGQLRFVLLRRLGEAFLCDQISEDNIIKTLSDS